tara:strand:- start:117 stop:617 length:501 start_codon:yes stop_codon:yes gene_type:complete
MVKEGKSYTTEDRQEAMGLYLRGHGNAEIARKMNKRYKYNLTAKTISRWAAKGGWDEYRNQVEIDLIEHTKNTVVGDMAKNMHELEEARQTFMSSLRDGKAEIRGHEFVKMTEVLGKLQDFEKDKEEMISRINLCIHGALEDVGMEKRLRQEFLRAYIARLRGDDK